MEFSEIRRFSMIQTHKKPQCLQNKNLKRIMRQREFLDFRTPQHPSLGTNHWGGASPLLAREIPKESLEQRYLNINTTRTRDEIFPAEDFFKFWPHTYKSKVEVGAVESGDGRGFFWRFRMRRKEKVELGGDGKKRRWFPRWDSHNRWPQGWGWF